MNTWRRIRLSVTPKAHIFEDNEIESMQALNCLVDKTRYFIELSHQDGACQYRCTQGLRGYKKKHTYQQKANH